MISFGDGFCYFSFKSSFDVVCLHLLLYSSQADQDAGSLKEELKKIIPQLEEMRKRKCDRRNQFVEVLEQIQRIASEINRSKDHLPLRTVVDESDLSLRKLEELHRQLHTLQIEKV